MTVGVFKVRQQLGVWVHGALSYLQESLGELPAQPLEDMEAKDAEWPLRSNGDLTLHPAGGGKREPGPDSLLPSSLRHLGDIQ